MAMNSRIALHPLFGVLEDRTIIAKDGNNNSVLQPYQFTYQRNLPGDKTLVTGLTSPVGSTQKTYEPSRDNVTQLTNDKLVGTLSDHGYAYNSLGQRALHYSASTAPGSGLTYLDYAYNARGEVAAETTSLPSPLNRAYEYDAIGNRKRAAKGDADPVNAPFATGAVTHYAADDLNQYSAITIPATAPVPTFTPDHDSDGNLLDDDQFLYEWDAENRLVSLIPKVPADFVRRFTFGYDYLGRRVKRVTDVYYEGDWYAECDNNFVYDGWNPVVDYHFEWGYSGQLFIDRFTWGLDLSGTLQGAGGVGGLLSVNHNDQLNAYNQGVNEYFYTYDANGNISELVDINQNVAAHYEYDAFGNETVNTAATSGNPEIADWNPFRFSTKWSERTMYYYGGSPQSTTARDREFSYYGYRFYDPENGRWLSRDPIGELGGMNMYGMIGNEATCTIDLLGLAWHHLLPPEVFDADFVREIGLEGILNPDSKEFGIELDFEDHWQSSRKGGSIHHPRDDRPGWNREWKRWRDDFERRGVIPSMDDILEKLEKLRGEYDDFLSKGRAVTGDYDGTKWDKRKKKSGKRVKGATSLVVILAIFYELLSEASDPCEAQKLSILVLSLNNVSIWGNSTTGWTYATDAATAIHEFFPAPYDPGITAAQLINASEQ